MDSRYLAAELVRRNGPRSVPTITWGEEPAPSRDATRSSPRASPRRSDLQHDWFEKPPAPHDRDVRPGRVPRERRGRLRDPLPRRPRPPRRARGPRLPVAVPRRRVLRQRRRPADAARRADRERARADRAGTPPTARCSATTCSGGSRPSRSPRSRATLDGLRSTSPTSRRGELWYAVGRAPVPRAATTASSRPTSRSYAPLLDRALLERLRTTPDRLRTNKALLQAALDRRFPGGRGDPVRDGRQPAPLGRPRGDGPDHGPRAAGAVRAAGLARHDRRQGAGRGRAAGARGRGGRRAGAVQPAGAAATSRVGRRPGARRRDRPACARPSSAPGPAGWPAS